MKGKLKLSLKIILTAAISLFAGVCFVGLQPAINAKKQIPAHAVVTLKGEEYSALLGGDVVLSVEKVAVDESGFYSQEITGNGANKFYQRAKGIEEYKSDISDRENKIKNDFNAGLPIFYVKDGKFNKVENEGDISSNLSSAFYMGAFESVEGETQIKNAYNEGALIYYVKDNKCVKVSSLEDVQNNSSCKFYIIGELEKPIYFQDIYQNEKPKQVVEDGQFVMLNNKNIGGQYVNSETSQSDAIIISLGQYVYYNGNVSNAPATLRTTDNEDTQKEKGDTSYAQMSLLNVNIMHNGQAVDGISIRNINTADGGHFFDFMYMITENGTNDIEGHYILSFEYMKGGVLYSSDFDFYLVCESTYTRTKTVNGQTYSSAPQLGWSDGGNFEEKLPNKDGYVHYNEGINGINIPTDAEKTSTISYPTITYDYTKYQLSYELTANRSVTNYSFTYSIKANRDVEMTCVISGFVNDEKRFLLTNYNQDLKLVTIVFTEQGNYDFSFKYLYTGADAISAPSMDKLKINNKKLSIHGVDLNYSKQDYTGAQFRKFNFASNSNAGVDLIIPNGYEQTNDEANIQQYKNKALETMYTLNKNNLLIATNKAVRIGDVVISDQKDSKGEFKFTDRTEDTLQNRNLSKKINSEDNSYKTLTAVLNTYAKNIIDTSKYDDLDLDVFEYIKTNQGSMWLSYTDKILETKDNASTIDGSFYFYGKNAITESSLVKVDNGTTKTSAQPYNNQTSFNKVGYYLVFIKIDPNSDTTATDGKTDDFWQVYAFQYMSDTIDIVVKTVPNDSAKNGLDVGAGKFTTENVTVSWTEPETFETKIVGRYYKLNSNASREELLNSNVNGVLTNNSNVLGEDVASGQFAKYLIKLERAGKSATYKMFTIDREPIKGVSAYAIKTRASSSAVYYEFASKNGNDIQILNGITNSYSTLVWNQKGSGAKITATYSYTPFVSDSSITPDFVNGKWITTKYSLGTTIKNCDLLEVISRSNVDYDSVLMGQGIYVFTIIDEAGNATKYMLVIDNTEALMQIYDGKTTEIVPNGAYRLYGNNVTYTTGSHKAIKLNTTDGDEIDELIPLITQKKLANYSTKDGIKFYTGDSSASVNMNAMYNLFANHDAKNYLIVSNQKVVAYNNYSIDEENSDYAQPLEKTIVFDEEKLNGETSLVRTLYIVGANMIYSASYNDASPNQSISHIDIEINKDNARGMAYYGNTLFTVDKVPQNGASSASVIKLQTGSDVLDEDENIKISGLGTIKGGAHATRDKYVAFTWLVGEEKFTVKTLKYQYYELNLSGEYFDTLKYFYKENGNEVTLYDGVPKDPNVVVKNGRGFFMINTDYDGTTRAGLYKFTRYYKYDPNKVEDYVNGKPVDYGDDTYSLTYYFIVDRNGIHDITNNIGNNIHIGLLESSTKLSGDKFSVISTASQQMKYDGNNDGDFIDKEDIINDYYLYFSTNRVPATLHIPTGKYYNGKNSSHGYFSGQLRLSVYYQDSYGQIDPDKKDSTYKIFEQNVPNDEDYYQVNIYKYLKTYDSLLADKLIVNTKDDDSWLHLKGRYIVVIEDNVKSSSTIKTNKIIAFDIIEEKYPEATIKVGGKNDVDEMTTLVANGVKGYYEVTTNQEFVRLELPKINLNNDNEDQNILAQVDQQYILVKQNINNQAEREYIKAEYNEVIGEKDRFIVDDETGVTYVDLDTLLLRDESGKILSDNFNKPLYYTITIRYQIGNNKNQANREMYKDCYVYYTYPNDVETKNYYYTATYTIVIDRLAPTANVESLRKNDNLIKQGYVDAKFEASYREQSRLYFTYQYADYYNNGNKLSDIYAFRVSPKTIFSKEDKDLNSLYVSTRSYTEEELKNLTLDLPIVNFAGFISKELNKITDFGSIFGTGSNSAGYYQVLEIDKAGNMTQYVVYYTTSAEEYLSIPVTYTPVDPSELIGDNEKVSVDIGNSLVSRIEMYDILTDGAARNSGDYFFHVALKDVNNIILDNWKPLNIVTNFATAYSGDNSISNQIVNAIGSRKGTYELTITSRTGQPYNLAISVYSEEDKIELDVERLIKDENGNYYKNNQGKYLIKLGEANITKGNNVFYAKEIIVVEKVEGEEAETTRYFCRPGDNYNYYDANGIKVDGGIIICRDNATYKLTLTDVFGVSKSTRFNTTGKEFYSIEFDDFKTYYINEQGHYYAYSNAILTFDEIFTIANNNISISIDNKPITPSVNIIGENNWQIKYQDMVLVEVKDHKIFVNRILNAEQDKGAILNVILQFYEIGNDQVDRTFNITIDTTTKAVTLKDFTTGDSKKLKLYNNVDISEDIEELKNCRPTDVTSGIMNLSWTIENKDNYVYSYQLFELKKIDDENNKIVEHLLNGVSNFVVDTQEDSLGIYWFVINIMSPNGYILGNKIYAFEVQSVNNQLYYVKNEEGLAINPNSIFKAEDVEGFTFTDDSFKGDLPTTNLPLYITNQQLEVVLTENVTAKTYTATLENDQKLIIYEIDATTYQLYFGILQIVKTDYLVKKENVSGVVSIGATEFVTLVDENNPDYTFNAERVQNSIGIFAKNLLLLDVYYNGVFVKTIEFGADIEFDILGNGSYSFEIRDLAGNKHVYANETKTVEVLVLREVVVTINDQAPVENAYYNDEVSLKVYAATKYVTGSIVVTAERNGKPYTLPSSNPYIFNEYGTYIVNISARYKDANGDEHTLSKRLTFSIINVNEVRTSIDLTNLSQHRISKVLNPNGIDVTEEFMHMINNKTNAMLIKHEEIMQNAENLQVSAGKLMFTVEYLVSDGIYPDRTLQVQFTLNDEEPVINCSLAVGESTTKSFNISFNPGIIFEQIGESYIYINDEIAYIIDANSPMGVIELTRAYKEDGAGDYYIKLVGTSGNVWQSFKVEIKEPLNAGAIIIIIVVVAVVATVVITIIVLRRKMRIR